MLLDKKSHKGFQILYNIDEVENMEERNVNEELIYWKKRNHLNNIIIAVQLVILLIVCIVAIYVRVI